MNKNSVLYELYPEEFQVEIPAKWIFVAEDLLTEEQYKEWLFYSMRYFGFCGMSKTGDTVTDMLLDAVYDEDEEFFNKYFDSILKKRQKEASLTDQLKVMRAWTKEEQLDAYTSRQNR